MIRPINQLISLAMQRQWGWNLKPCWSCIQKTWVCSLSSSLGTYWLGHQSLKPYPGSFILALIGKKNCSNIYLQSKELGYLSPGSGRVFQRSGLQVDQKGLKNRDDRGRTAEDLVCGCFCSFWFQNVRGRWRP